MLVSSLDFRIRQAILIGLVKARRYDRTMYVVYDDDNGWITSDESPEKREPFFRISGRKNHVEYISKHGDSEKVEGTLIRKGVMEGPTEYYLQ